MKIRRDFGLCVFHQVSPEDCSPKIQETFNYSVPSSICLQLSNVCYSRPTLVDTIFLALVYLQWNFDENVRTSHNNLQPTKDVL